MLNRITRSRRVPAIAGAVLVIAVIGGGSATAASLVTSKGVQDDSLRSVDVKDGSLRVKDLTSRAVHTLQQGSAGTGASGSTGATGAAGATGAQGPKGDKGSNGLLGAFYATAFYNVGDTNAGAIATVACSSTSTDFTAISGGVQVLGIGDNQAEIDAANARNTPVSSSFPGRMDWSTNTPKSNRLDGWIVQFGGNAGATSDKDPVKVKVWALCVPDTSIPVTQTYIQQ
jgi:hypothetical protein